jgi:hypothetical protein
VNGGVVDAYGPWDESATKREGLVETKQAKGRQGWWFAVVDGVPLPCLHKHWLTGADLYHGPFKRHEGKGNKKRIMEAVEAIQSGRRVVLTDDKAELDSNGDVTGFDRKNYIAVFEVDNVTYSPSDGLRLRLVKRIFNLK